jgi:hypothetical protein
MMFTQDPNHHKEHIMATIDSLTNVYGTSTAPGILIDHLQDAEALGMVLHVTERWGWLTSGKGQARRVVCGDIVELRTEDGVIDARCGHPVVTWAPGVLGTGCPAHDLGPAHADTCPHGMSAALCAGPGHYPMDR